MLPWFVFFLLSLFFRKGSPWLFFTCAPFSCCFLAAFFMVRFFRRVPAISCPLSELLNGEGGSWFLTWGGSPARHSTGWKIGGEKLTQRQRLLTQSFILSLTHLLCCPFAALSLRPFAREGVPNSFALFTSCLLLQRTLSAGPSPSLPLSPSFSLWLLQPDCISLFCLTFGVRSLARSLTRLLACPCVTFIIIPLPPFEFFSPHKGEVPQLATHRVNWGDFERLCLSRFK